MVFTLFLVSLLHEFCFIDCAIGFELLQKLGGPDDPFESSVVPELVHVCQMADRHSGCTLLSIYMQWNTAILLWQQSLMYKWVTIYGPSEVPFRAVVFIAV